ncbi:hypothetical protein pneo_cds_567 [Pandoravirus neocaledonia]|uniref:DUF5848 domain-containing protein n=1 Tax=Pandoravirus neocaledonia TaxID=2107708 RepID=A0A2U7UCJ7_9VIRU|nr:hypothetical protein pneo_cds_567 [Pandoravirus neocaledonia]AVK76174.1 hypothetical protein pneo_cds_567 [Pandoravirus neocaledonia]
MITDAQDAKHIIGSSVSGDPDGDRDTDRQHPRDDPTRWQPPRDGSETATRLDALCRWAEDWIAAPDADRRLTPADVAALCVLESDCDLHAGYPCQTTIRRTVRILRAYVLFWRALHAIAVRRAGFVPCGPWPLTASAVCRSLNVSGVIETAPSASRVVQAHNLAELFFASRRGSEEQLSSSSSAARPRSDDALTRIVVGTYADGSRHFVVHNKHMMLTATDYADLDDGLIESERALGYSALLRWAEVAVVANQPALAGLETVATHHDLCPQAAAALHVRALQRGTLLVSQAAATFSQLDLVVLRAAMPRLARLLDRLHARPRDLQVASALVVARSCARLTDPGVLSCLCREMVGLVVATRLLVVESPSGYDKGGLMDDAARALDLACAHGSCHRPLRGIDIALALATL